MIVELAVFEKLEHLVVATEALLHDGLFGQRPSCEAIIGEANGEVVTFALFFHNFSTFLTRKGLYLKTCTSSRRTARDSAARCW